MNILKKIQDFCQETFSSPHKNNSSNSIIHAKRKPINQKGVGVNWYIWRAVGGKRGDGRTRYSHKAMSGILCRYDNPPSPEFLIGEKSIGTYHPGEIDGCRCYDEPLIDLEDIKFPCQVHIDGKIVKMTKKQFKEFAKM